MSDYENEFLSYVHSSLLTFVVTVQCLSPSRSSRLSLGVLSLPSFTSRSRRGADGGK